MSITYSCYDEAPTPGDLVWIQIKMPDGHSKEFVPAEVLGIHLRGDGKYTIEVCFNHSICYFLELQQVFIKRYF